MARVKTNSRQGFSLTGRKGGESVQRNEQGSPAQMKKLGSSAVISSFLFPL